MRKTEVENANGAVSRALARNRLWILRRLERALEIPMALLGAVWLVLMVVGSSGDWAGREPIW